MFALELHKLSIQFGGLKAVSNVDLKIPEKSIFGLIGPNGAGKTTVFNLITGVYQPTSGSIKAFGNPIHGLRPFEVVPRGLSRTFQNIRLFKELTVVENLLIANDHHRAYESPSWFNVLFRTKSFIESEKNKKDHCLMLLKIFGLADRANELALNLPYGDQRRLEIARALATGARVLLLDEPAAGMNEKETNDLMRTIKGLREQLQITILLIEHDMRLVMGICETIAVLDYGIKIAEGTPREIQSNSAVIEVYLGKAASA